MKTKFIIFLMLLGGMMKAQSTLSGKVTDLTGKALPNVLITVPASGVIAMTDTAGNFSLEVAGLPVTVKVSGIGYSDVHREVTTSPVTIRMEPAPVIVSEVMVTDAPADYNVIQPGYSVSVANAKNPNDLFGQLPGVSLVKRGNFATEPVVRGFKYDQLNIRYDGLGKSVHACPNHMDPVTSHLAPEDIEKIEIIKGPYEVRYGNAYGGMINLVTDPGKRIASGFHGKLNAGYGLNGNSFSSHLGMTYATNGFDWAAGGTYRNFGDYRDGRDTLVPSGFKTGELTLKSGLNFGDNRRLQAKYRYTGSRDVKHAGLPMDSPKDISQIFRMDFSQRNLSSKVSKLTAGAFYSTVDHLMDNKNRPSFYIMDAQTPVFARSLGGRISILLTPRKNVLLYTGVDVNSISRKGTRSRLVKRNPVNPEIVFDPPKQFYDTVWGEAQMTDAGAYIQSKFFPNPKWALQAGLRADFNHSSLGTPASELLKYYGAITPRLETLLSGHLTADYKIRRRTHIKLSIGRGVRPANMEERFINHLAIGSDPFERLGNPELKAEKNYQTDLDFRHRTSALDFRVSLFYSTVLDHITAVLDTTLSPKFLKTMPGTKRFVNIDRAVKKGFEAGITYRFAPHWYAGADAAYTEAYNQATHEPLPLIPPMETHVKLGYNSAKYSGQLSWRYVAAQDKVSASFGETPSEAFSVIDLQLGATWRKRLKIGFSVNNLLDADYYEHLNFSYKKQKALNGRIYEPGRNAGLFVNYAF